jgi:tetratricopeptide (TPR) repeat protein
MRQTKCPKQWRTGSQRALAARAAKKYISGSIAPGCAEGGRIGVPHGYVADTVVCPRCRQVVRVREDDRVLWRGNAVSFGNDEIAPSAAGKRSLRGRTSRDDSSRGRRRGSWREEERRFVGWLGSGAALLPVVLSAAAFMMAFSIAPASRARKTASLGTGASSGQRRRSASAASASAGDRSQRGNAAQSAAPPRGDTAAPRAPAAPRNKHASPATRQPHPTKPRAPANRPKRPADVQPQPPVPSPSRPVMLYRRAIARLKAKNYAGALDDLDEVLLTSPNMGRALYYHAEALAGLGRLAEALDELNQTIDAKPNDPWPWRARGLLHARRRQWLPAAADLRQAIAIQRKKAAGADGPFVNKLADKLVDVVDQLDRHASELIKQGRFAAARDELTEVLKHQPDSASARLRRAVAHAQLKDDDRALEDFDVALWLRPSPAQGYWARADVHERRGDYAAALADLDTAVKLAPERSDYREHQRRLRSKLGAGRWPAATVRPATWRVP